MTALIRMIDQSITGSTMISIFNVTHPAAVTITPVPVPAKHPKLIVRSELLYNDPAKHNIVGCNVLHKVLKIGEIRRYNDCLTYKKKNELLFLVSMKNSILLKVLYHSTKRVLMPRFRKRVSSALKLLGSHLTHCHSTGPASDGEECSPNLKSILELYTKIEERVSDDPKITPAADLTHQTSLLPLLLAVSNWARCVIV